MSYTSVFGGNTIYPSDVSYLSIALSVDTPLEWPLESSGMEAPAARIIDVDPTADGFSVVLPNATLTGAGQTILFNNIDGVFSFFVKDYAGNTLATVIAGTQWQVYLAATTTAAGTWRVFRYGASTATVQPSALAGPGLIVDGSQLAQSLPVRTFTTTPVAVSAAANRAEALVWIDSGTNGAGTFSLPTAASAGNNFFIFVRNSGVGDLTIAPQGSETINGAATLVLRPGDSATVITDGTTWYTVGLGQEAVFAFDFTIINLSGLSGDYTLSGSELNRIAYRFTTDPTPLTGDVYVIVPPTIQQYWITNATTGSFQLYIKTSTGVATPVQQGAKGIYYCDGTNMVLASDPTTLTTPISVSQGGTGGTTQSSARSGIGITTFGDSLATAVDAPAARGFLSAAASGANSDITSLTGLTTALSPAQGGTGLTAAGTSGNVLTSNGTAWVSAAPAASPAVAYPQNVQSANYTLVLGDAGKQIFHPAADTAVRTYTIPANGTVAFPIGTVVLFTVENGGAPVNVSIDTDTLVFGDGTTGTISVFPNNTLMAIKVTSTKWMANYLYQTGNPSDIGVIAIAHDTSPYLTAYIWSAAGFGAKYSDPATLPGSTGQGVSFSPAGNAVAVASLGSPSVTAYPWNSATGFGVKYANPATLPAGLGYSVDFDPSGDAIAVGHGATPYISAYPWSITTGFGTKFTNPATIPTGTGYNVAFSPAGNAIAIAHGITPFISAYPWSAAIGFGIKYTNPATLPAGTARGVAFSPAGDAVAVAHSTTPYISAYPWNVSTGFGIKYTNPATLPGLTGSGVAFSPAGDAVAVTYGTTPYVSAYPWSVSGFGVKYANPAATPTGAGNGVAFSPAGDAVAVVHSAAPYISAYPWDASTGFGVKYNNPATSLPDIGNGVAFYPF